MIPVVTHTPRPSNPPLKPRVYDSNTFIDWTTESLVPNSSLSRKWTSLIMAALIVGYITTFVDLASVWVNDLKKGMCFGAIDKWSLLDPYRTCPADQWFDWLQILFNSTSITGTVLVNFPIYVFFATILALVAAYITMAKNPLSKQSGIPEMKMIIQGLNFHLNEYLGAKTLFYKTLGLILVVSLGLWLGKEGPLVHVSCCIVNLMYQLVFNDPDQHQCLKRELLCAAVATGISVAFNSPIGGVLFVLECIPSFFTPTKIMWNSFVSATIAVVVLTGFKIFTHGGNFVEQDMFSVNFGNFSWLFMEFVPFVFLGVLGGVYGHVFTKVYLKFSDRRWKHRLHLRLAGLFGLSVSAGRYLEVLIVILVTCVLNFPLPLTRLPHDAFLRVMFTDCPAETAGDSGLNAAGFVCLSLGLANVSKLLFIGIQGFFLSAYTFGLTLPGGILMPSLCLGATAGRLVGIVSLAVQRAISADFLSTCTEKSCLVSPSSYAVVGAGAFMAGITKLTMCVVVILFELTGAISYVLPIMSAVMVLKFVNDKLCNENIYDWWLKNAFNTGADPLLDPPAGNSDVNYGKGSGVCDFTNLTASVKIQHPDVDVEKVMVPTAGVRCLEMLPSSPHSVQSLLAYMANDNHEGYPLILSYERPVSCGYANKQDLYRHLLDVNDSHASISFQLPSWPSSALSDHIQYENKMLDPVKVWLEPENPFVVVNKHMPSMIVLEMFEKLSLNYLIIFDGDEMAGFVDRFILARLINSRFELLQTREVEFEA